MKIALFGRDLDPRFFPDMKKLVNVLKANDTELILHQRLFQFLKEQWNCTPEGKVFSDTDKLDSDTDFFFSIGGDGTFLEAAGYVRENGIPVVGFNTGRLGFLADLSLEEIENVFQCLSNGNFRIEKRSLLEVKTENNLFSPNKYALNEVTVHKMDTSSMITVHAYLDDQFLNSYWADGLIVATPTGSTAYSMSVGGPIVAPESGNLIITPIAPHNLTNRPLVIHENIEIKLKVDGRSDYCRASVDYRSEKMSLGSDLIIRKAPFSIHVVKLPRHNFYSTLRNKLMWGLDKRN